MRKLTVAVMIVLESIAANFLVACFTRETPIVTSLEGDSRRAEWIRKDDLLACRSEFDPQGPLELRRVEEVFVRFAPIVHLHVRDRVIRTTAEHPFHVLDKGWVPAGELQPGDQLVGHDGQFVAVGEVFDTGEFEQVYNFRVADHHTYFVGGNEWGFSVWARNAKYAVTVQQPSTEPIHGNSLTSPRTAYLYRLEDAKGNFLKWGVTQDMERRYTQAYMLDKRMFKVAEDSRADIIRMERGLVETQPGPRNLERWAGSRLGEQP